MITRPVRVSLTTVSGKSMTKFWFRTDECEDIISSLKQFIASSEKINDDDANWKWAILSLHSAVQSMMAFHLGFGNDLLVMTQADAEGWLQAYENETQYPSTKMDTFPNLYKKIKKHPILGFKYEPKGQEGKSIKKLNQFRNEFIHFMPKGWVIGLGGMPDIFSDCLNIIETIGNSPTGGRWYEANQSDTFNSLMLLAREQVNALKNH